MRLKCTQKEVCILTPPATNHIPKGHSFGEQRKNTNANSANVGIYYKTIRSMPGVLRHGMEDENVMKLWNANRHLQHDSSSRGTIHKDVASLQWSHLLRRS